MDYLVNTTRGLTEFASPVVVSDGDPIAGSASGIAIGVTPEDPDSENSLEYAQTGAQAEWENVDIPCILWAEVGGDKMKPARDAAFVLFNAFMTMIRTDRSLGDAVKSNPAGVRVARVSQTRIDSGRRCEIRFNVSYKSRLAA